MAHHQHLDIRQRKLLYELFLRISGHVPGDKGIKIPCGAQIRQSLLVQISRAHRRIDGQHGAAHRQSVNVRHHGHSNVLLPGQLQQPVPHAVLVLNIRQQQPLHRHPGQQLLQPIGVVGVIVGHRHRRQPVDAHALQLVCRPGSGADIAVAGSAVHQHRLLPGIQGHTLALVHVQRHHGQVSIPVQPGVESHRQQQRHRRQSCGRSILPHPVPGQRAPAEHGIHIQQPVFQKTVGKIHRMPRDGGQQPGGPQHIPYQPEAYPTQHPGRRQPHKAHQHRYEAGHKIPARRRYRQQIAHRRSQRQNVEVDRRQRNGKNQRRQRCRYIGAHKVHRPPYGPFFPGIYPGHGPIQLRRQPHQSQRGRKAQL